MRNKYLQFGLGMIVGGLLCGTTAAAADYLTASPTTFKRMSGPIIIPVSRNVLFRE